VACPLEKNVGLEFPKNWASRPVLMWRMKMEAAEKVESGLWLMLLREKQRWRLDEKAQMCLASS
jgi:hypothetical protein